MKTLNIIRGIPGSGKSTFVQKNKSLTDAHFEADMYHLTEKGYNWNQNLISKAHEWCYDSCRIAMARQVQTIWVSNTFTRKWEFSNYIDLAELYGYQVNVIRLQGEYENIHNVPAEAVQIMKNRFEDFEGEELR